MFLMVQTKLINVIQAGLTNVLVNREINDKKNLTAELLCEN